MEPTNFYGSLCLTDIPKELIITGKNGKKYLNIEVRKRHQPSQYGQTHNIKAATSKDNRREGVNYYIGALKPSIYQGDGLTNDTSVNSNAPAPQETDNLPF